MASVISSARRSTTSAFDLITTTATTLNQVISSGSLAADALHLKAQHMHESVRMSILSDLVNIREREVATAAANHVDFLEDIFKRNHPNQSFNRAEALEATIARMEQAIDAHK